MNWIKYGWVVFLLALAACRPQLLDPPRLATATAVANTPPTAESAAEPVFISAPTSSAEADPAAETESAGRLNPTLVVWINETSPAHESALHQLADEFGQTYGIDVEMVLIPYTLLPELMETAVLSDTMPDIVLHQMAYSIGWAERGILDAEAADAVADTLGRETFDPDGLKVNTYNGRLAALPSDGYHQILIYRKDWFDENKLAIPNNYDAMLAAAEAIHDPDNLRSGFVMPTESNLVTTHEGFEQIATANGCELINTEGEVTLLSPACQEAIDFYYRIVHQFSPVGVQTDTSTQNAYLNGRTGMIISTPHILPQLAHADDDLAANSGILTGISDDKNRPSAMFGNLTNLGITTVANQEAASAFAIYWFEQFYTDWLAIESEEKVPMRWGTAVSPTQFIDKWGTLPLDEDTPSLTALYGSETVATLRDGIADSNRWAFAQGQGSLIAALYKDLTFPVILQEMLSGYFGTEKTRYELYSNTVELIPDYPYPITPEQEETVE